MPREPDNTPKTTRAAPVKKKCGPCAGTGKRHSIFDFCDCDVVCEDLGKCAACGGSGLAVFLGRPRG